jgi:uncharacterized lipoprotein YbaY
VFSVMRRPVLLLFLLASTVGVARHASALSLLQQATALQQSTGSVAGQVVDDSGAPVAEALVTLESEGRAPITVAAGSDGQFLIMNVGAGPFRVTVAAAGFATQTASGSVVEGERAAVPPIRLRLSVNAVSVDVTPSVVEVAEQELKEETQQRVLGFVPNFYLSFNPDAAPLNPEQKWKLAWKARTDPVQFAGVAIVAGVQQANGLYDGFGDGLEGYAKRYAAAYATVWTRSMLAEVLLPSLFRQDPRYFYKGTGSTAARLGYAVSRTVVRRGDNKHWQPNYSGILGSFAAGALSNLYYPAEDRRGAHLMLENTAIAMAAGAAGLVAQEFLWGRITSRHGASAGK